MKSDEKRRGIFATGIVHTALSDYDGKRRALEFISEEAL